MNHIFKIVFNHERGTSMVVNETTSSVQAGKKAAIVVATVSALASGSALAVEDFVKNETVTDGIIEAQNITITSDSSNAINIFNPDTPLALQVNAQKDINLTAKKNGIQFQSLPDSNIQNYIKAAGSLKIDAGGVGIHVTSPSKDSKGSSLDIEAKQIDIKAGAGVLNSSSGTVKLNAQEDISITATERLGISSAVNSAIAMEAANIKIDLQSTKGADRIAVNAPGSISLKADNRIDIIATSVSGEGEASVRGIRTEKGNSVVSVDAKEIHISATTDNTFARAVTATENAKVTLGNRDTENISIIATGNDQLAKNITIGLQAVNNKADLTVNGKNLYIEAKDNGKGWAYAVSASSNTLDSTMAVLNINAENTTIVASTATKGNSNGIVAMSEGTVNVTGNLTVKADNVITTRGHSLVNINQNGDKIVKLDGDIEFNYDQTTSGTAIDSTVKLNLSNSNSYLNGNIQRTGGATEDKNTVTDMRLSLSNGGTWTSTADSFVNELTLADGGIVNINLEDGKSHNVTVNTLKGESGIVNIEVAKDENLTHGSLVLDKDYARPATKPASDSTTSKVAVNLTGVTADDISADQLKKLSSDVIQKAEKTDFDLGHTTTVAEGDYNGAMTTETDKDGNVSDAKVATNTLMRDSLDLASASVLSINRILMNDVRKRLGDLRSAEGTDGVWARYDGGKLSGDHGLENDFHTIQFGYDTALGAGYPRIGFAGSYTMGDAEYARGDADMDAYSLAAYSTWMADNGMFADVIARVAKVDTDMTVDGTKKGSLDNFAASLSGEFGWRFNVTETFYVEPQAELTYTYIDSDSLALSNGSKYKFDAVDSLMGRAGFAAGFKCPQDKGDVYVRVSAVHEFLGDAAVTGGNGTVHEIDGKDTWVEYGVGANFNVNKNTYIYADVERTSGATLDEDWRANVGVRYSF